VSGLRAVRHDGHEHEFEAAPGLPERLPSDETLLWQGGPDWKQLARERFHVRALALYFAVILALRAGFVIADGGSAGDAASAVLMLLPLVLAALGMMTLLAWLSARTTVYTITDRRVVMRVGIVLSLTFNLPLSRIESAGLKLTRDGHGNIPLLLAAPDRIALLHLWPHARPWRAARPEPMLCCIADAARVAGLLTEAWQAARSDAPQTTPAAIAQQADTPAPRARRTGRAPQLVTH